ncbi:MULTISPECIES: DUF4240 domain-containing protein [Pseudoalteromonas]|uniref:DUF4240 domain-containing protein n=1 Tax=Pseudoalteromonas haloplanktis TaxID=228 RepID=A0ABU1B984_PSEHA|nr:MULTISPECIES: DUF4240 domain-containing protein [Pseudoalteromonas]MCF6146977.1 hypothetical protein [Pseudoalteromonas mariniglutinosa NCIMB 1770]MDQ9090074.1 DUF4240 domain-containing protein [Pseudoalteromonas haloplanktis]TMN72768.1 DUF4240 domain-containing protein [Pseudoalteromonas sp. S1727]
MSVLSSSEFWQLVTVEDKTAEPESVSERLKSLLSDLTDDQLIEFDKQFSICMRQSYTWELFGAAFVMAGCNDDYGFSEFRCWLISRGEAAFNAALENPDSLAECTPVYHLNEQPYPYLDEYDLIAGLLYEARNDDELPFVPSGLEQPKGKRFKDKAKFLKLAYPQLFAKYWQ